LKHIPSTRPSPRRQHRRQARQMLRRGADCSRECPQFDTDIASPLQFQCSVRLPVTVEFNKSLGGAGRIQNSKPLALGSLAPAMVSGPVGDQHTCMHRYLGNFSRF
jgi:hypothetical protein